MISAATTTIPRAALLIGVSRNSAYEEASRTGQLGGVPVIRVGRRLVVATALLNEVLGLTTTREIDRLLEGADVD